jgi:SNF2 family DNA or RNA helicase
MLKDKSVLISQLYGGQPKSERDKAVNRFSNLHPQADELIAGRLRCVLLAQQHAGGHGLNLIAATEVIYLSNDWSLGIRLQSEDRCHRPGQRNVVNYIDVLATGPDGQHTIDRTIYAALAKKQDLSKMTTDAWRRELSE